MYGRQESDHPQEKETQKGKMGIEEALQRVVKRREAKSKGEKERYICIQVKKQQLEPGMEQWTCSKLGKEQVKDITLLI